MMALSALMKAHGICSQRIFHNAPSCNRRPKPLGSQPHASKVNAKSILEPYHLKYRQLGQVHSVNRRPRACTSAKGGSDGDSAPIDPAPVDAAPAVSERLRFSPGLVTLTGAAAFTAIASDIFLPGSPHLLAPLDTTVASWVETNMPVTEDGRFWARFLSNFPITLALVGIAVASLASGVQRPMATLQRLSAAIAVLTAPGWTITSKDFPVVDILKNLFTRNRPAFGLEHSSTFSFPSGHTFVCLFLLGTIAIMARTTGKQVFEVKAAAAVTAVIKRYTLPLLCFAAVTATGRILSDVHWVSDTMAGAAAATTMLGFTLILLEALDKGSDT